MQVCLGNPTEAGLCRHRCCSAAGNTQGQPKGYFQMKELQRTTKAIAQMNADWKVEKAKYAEFNVPTCGTIAVWQLCRERQPLWNRHDGLNVTCSAQCRSVRSHGKGSSQSWRQRSVKRQSELDPWVYTSLHPCFKPTWFLQVCLGKPSYENRQR